MSIGWNGLSMPTNVFSVYMPTGIINFKVRGVKKDSVPYMMVIILAFIPIQCGIVGSNENKVLYCSG